MNVLLLSPYPQFLTPTIVATGDDYIVSMADPENWPENMDFVISFGYRKKIVDPFLFIYEGRLINIHVSLLPWNRGADPNFWSWFDRTPKGASIHMIDSGIDTGPVINQMEIKLWDGAETLASSYTKLQTAAMDLFGATWPRIRKGDWMPMDVTGAGTCHKAKDKYRWMNSLPLGWQTPVRDVERLGDASRG